MNTSCKTIAPLVMAGLLGACSWMPKMGNVVRDSSADYKTSQTRPPLEVPPDLTKSTIDDLMVVPDVNAAGTATYSDYASERKAPQKARRETVLVQPDDVHLERDGNYRWLVIGAPPDVVWKRVHNFWIQQGFLIKREDPRVGIVETEWAENRADIPQGFIRRSLGKILDSVYSAATRDKFRVRLERGEQAGTTNLYLTHRGMQEVAQGETFVWQARPSDPELEAEMLSRIMVAFGIDKRRAETKLANAAPAPKRAHLVSGAGGSTRLRVDEGFARAWQRTGLALDRVGFTVEDRDRAKGLYYVRYIDPDKDSGEKKSFLSKLAFWRRGSHEPDSKAQLQIKLLEQGDHTTEVVVRDKDGGEDKSDTARRILSLLEEQLK